MRTLKQFLNEYQESHQNPVNSWIHIFCVPAIFFASLGLLWAIPLGRWLGLVPGIAPWINPVTLALPLVTAFYLKLSLGSALAMAVWFALSLAGILAIQAAQLPLVWICASVWVIAWIVQIYGHKIEGAKPSFADDMVFLLIGPLFVMQKLYKKVGMA